MGNVEIRTARSTERDVLAQRVKIGSAAWNLLTTLVLVVPVLGTFYPLDSYLAVGDVGPTSLASGGSTTSTYVVGASLLILALYIVSGRSFPILRRFGTILPMLIPLIAFSTVVWSSDPTYAANRSARLVLYVGFGLIFAEYFDFKSIISLLMRACLIAILCSDVVTVLRPDLGLSQIGGGYENAWRGATIHKNVLGQVCSISILVCFYSFVARVNRPAIRIATLVVSVVTLALSQSATSAVATGASLAIAFGLNEFSGNSLLAKIGLFAGFALAMVALVAIALSPDILFDILGRDATLTGRTYVWTAVWAALERSPFWGYGYGFWGIDSPARAIIWQDVNFQVSHSHDSWLDMWLQLGLPGLLDLIAIFVFLISTGAALYVRTGGAVATFSLALCASLLVRAGPEVEFTDPFPSALFWLSLVCGLLSRARMQKSEAAS
jgi:exopolysaccharide production protein ExoQ